MPQDPAEQQEDTNHSDTSQTAQPHAVERSKRPRVSFATVAMRTFTSGCEDPKKLSSPKERMLSPLAEASASSKEPEGEAAASNDEDTTQELRFPGINELCDMTPEPLRGQRNSMSGELGDVQRQFARAFGPSPNAGGEQAGGLQEEPEGRQSAASATGSAASGGTGRSSAESGGARAATGARGLPGATPCATPLRHKSLGSNIAGSEDGESLSPASGEVTAGVPALPVLLAQDELEAGGREELCPPSLPRMTPRPSRSPGTRSEASPVPESWDLFLQFKKTAPRTSTLSYSMMTDATCAAGEKGEALSTSCEHEVCLPFTSTAVTKGRNSADALEPNKSWPSSPRSAKEPEKSWPSSPRDRDCFSFSAPPAGTAAPGGAAPALPGAPPDRPARMAEDTVDMEGFVGRLREGPGGLAAAEADESEVPEGRKSFAARKLKPILSSTLQLATTGSSRPSSGTASEQQDGSPRLGSGFLDFAKLNEEFDQKAGQVPGDKEEDAVLGCGTGGTEGNAARGTGCSAGNFYPPGLGLLAGLGAQPHDLQFRGSLPKGVAPGRASPGGASEALESTLHCSFISTESAPLPGASSLHPIPHIADESSNHSGLATLMTWDEFLSHCGIGFGKEETGTAPTTQVPDVPQTHSPVAQLAHRRAVCLQRVQKDLSEKSHASAQRLDNQKQRWESSQQDLQLPSQQPILDARAKLLQADCKNSASLQWYDLKRDWLLQDLRLCRDHSSSIKHEEAELREATRSLQSQARSIEAALRQQRARCELLRSQRRMRGLARDDLRAAQEERQALRRCASEAREAVRAGKAATRDLGNRIEEEALQVHVQGQGKGADARAYLQKRLQRVQAQQLRSMRTCLVGERAATAGNASHCLDLSLRCGARARLAMPVVARGGLARVTLQLPALEPPAEGVAGLRPGAEGLRRLARELFAVAWRGVAARLPRSASVPVVPSASTLELTVACEEVPRLVRSLDYAAVRVWTQIEALRRARKERPEVVGLEARLREGGEMGSEAVLAVTASLLLERCAVRVGTEARVEASKCVVEFSADLTSFPEAINWADVTVRQVFGRGEAPAVARALRSQAGCSGCSGGLAEALSAAAEAMRRAAG